MKLVACVHFPGWPIQRLIAAHPELRYQQVVLYENHPQRGQIVREASPKARQAGVRPGQPVAEARGLLRHIKAVGGSRSSSGAGGGRGSERLHIYPYEPRVDRQALEELARDLEAFSPLIGLDSEDPPTGLLFDLQGLLPLFGSAEAWCERLRQHLESHGWFCRIGCGATIGWAWGAAHFGGAPVTGHSSAPPVSATLAETAADSPAQGNRLVSDPSRVWEAWPPAALRLPANLCEILQQLGLTTIGALRQIPAASLALRFGDIIQRRLGQAAGDIPETIRAVPRRWEQTVTERLEYPLSDQTAILEYLHQLVGRICQGLRERRQGSLVWLLELQRGTAPALHLRIGLFQASARPEQIMPLVRLQLEQHPEFDGFAHPVEAVTVSAGSPVLLVEQQALLFDEAPRQEAELGELLNRLAIRLGEDQVVSASCQTGVAPERGVTYRPWVGPRSVRPRRGTSAPPTDCSARPWRLLPRPREITPLGPALADQPWSLPAAFMLAECRSQSPASETLPAGSRWSIHRSWGPERIETGWWQGRNVRRDYWRVETAHGAQLWIFRDLRSQRWFLQGAF